MHPKQIMWELQELDLEIDATAAELENSSLSEKVSESREKLEQLEQQRRTEEDRVKETRKKLKRLELDLQENTDSQSILRRKLYGGEVSNVKELEKMEQRLAFLEREQDKLENQIIEEMETVENLEAAHQETAGLVKKEQEELAEKERLLEAQNGRLQEKLARLRREREELTGALEPYFLELYSNLAQRFQGRAIARVLNDICEGCSVFISSAQRGLLYNPSTMVYCENCGRLLLKLDESKDSPDRKAGERDDTQKRGTKKKPGR